MSESSRPHFLGRSIRSPLRLTKRVLWVPGVDADTLQKAAMDNKSLGICTYFPSPFFLLLGFTPLRRSKCGARAVPKCLSLCFSSNPEAILWRAVPLASPAHVPPSVVYSSPLFVPEVDADFAKALLRSPASVSAASKARDGNG